MIDLSNRRFGKLLALKPTEKRERHYTVWLCECDCGKQCEVASFRLVRGRTKSCGCLNRGLSAKRLEIGRENLRRNEWKENTSLCTLTAKTKSTNTSGRKGVWFDKRTGRWRAAITLQKHRHFLGYFDKFEDAVKARERAEEKLFEPILNSYGRSLYQHNK